MAAGLLGGLALGMIAGAAAYPGDGYWGYGGHPSYGYYGAGLSRLWLSLWLLAAERPLA